MHLKKKLTPPLGELSQEGGQVEIRKKDSYVLKRKLVLLFAKIYSAFRASPPTIKFMLLLLFQEAGLLSKR